MSKHNNKPVALAVGAALVGGLALSASAFAMSDLGQGYLLSASHHGEKTTEGKCGEGKCGMSKMDTDKDGKLSATEFAAAHKGDGSKFASYDTDKDGFITDAEMKAAHAAKSGDKPKAAMEGKCGEGKCGGMGS